MAYVLRRKNIWYVRYKDENNTWRFKSCGKNATRADAGYIANQYSAKELNRHHHRAPVRVLKIDLESALIKFRDEILPRGHRGNDKR